MIPRTADDLDALAAEARRQTMLVESLFRRESAERLRARPVPKRWSALGHLAHLCILNAAYPDSIEAAIDAGRQSGRLGDGPYRHPWLGRWLARSLEPPPRDGARGRPRARSPPPVADRRDARHPRTRARLGGRVRCGGGSEPGPAAGVAEPPGQTKTFLPIEAP